MLPDTAGEGKLKIVKTGEEGNGKPPHLTFPSTTE